jgi:hypothetical protein
MRKTDPYVSSDSSPDSDYDESQPMRLSNNLAAVASTRLRMRKRMQDDEHLPLLQAGDVHLGQHTAGASNTAGASGAAGTSNVASASNVVGASVVVGVSNSAGASAFPLAVAFLGTNITPGTGRFVGANFTLGASGSVGSIQATSATYPGIPRDNLRMLEIRSNLGAFASDPPDLERGLCGSNTVAL